MRRTVVIVAVTLVATTTRMAWAGTWTVGLSTGSKGQAHSLPVASPTGVTSSCPAPTTSRTVRVSWTAISHATFSVYVSTTSATSGYSLTASGVTGSNWTSGTLTSGTYWFEVATVYSTAWTSARSAAAASRVISSTSCS
jgi:hypothetical protein